MEQIRHKRRIFQNIAAVSIILCKWGNKIQVYFDLYLDSVLKYTDKLIHNQSPIRNRHRPFLLNLHQR